MAATRSLGESPPSAPVLRQARHTTAPESALSPSAARCGGASSAFCASSQALGGKGASATVLCFGDSLTKGINATRGNYPGILKDLLQAGGHTLDVHNAGVWGDSCDQLITRFPYVIKDAAARGRLAAILVLAGTNDLVRGGVWCSELMGKLRSLHEVALAAPGSPRVGVLTMPPANFGEAKEKARIFVNEELRKECAANPGLFLVDLESVPFNLSYDGLHYAAEGYEDFAQRALQGMAPFLHEF